MHEFSLNFLRCVGCKGKLELELLQQQDEIIEGLLYCKNCKLFFPIVSGIPILRKDFVTYLSYRPTLGGKLYHISKHKNLKQFIKSALSKIKKFDDKTNIEERWTRIYQENQNDKFYTEISKRISKFPKSKLALEHGCSIGTISKNIAKNSEIIFGIDNSFSSILAAKRNNEKNLDFFVANSLEHPFGNQKFELVVALNLLELIEPDVLIKTISKQIKKGNLVLSDPYDYDRGKLSVKNPISPELLRKKLQKNHFRIKQNCKKPSFIPWNLKINSRTKLCYLSDVIIATKS